MEEWASHRLMRVLSGFPPPSLTPPPSLPVGRSTTCLLARFLRVARLLPAPQLRSVLRMYAGECVFWEAEGEADEASPGQTGEGGRRGLCRRCRPTPRPVTLQLDRRRSRCPKGQQRASERASESSATSEGSEEGKKEGG